MKITTSRIARCAALLILLTAIPALAADVTSTWTMDDKDPDGNPSTEAHCQKTHHLDPKLGRPPVVSPKCPSKPSHPKLIQVSRPAS